MIRCLAIDDEPLALRQIRSYIERIPTLDLAATFSNAIAAQEWLIDNNVDLIFVDINMPGLSGVDFVRSLSNPPMIIFTTAYSEYAVEGFKLDAIDYLLKPFSFNELLHSSNKAISLHELRQLRNNTSIEKSEVTDEPSADKEYISVRANHKTSLIKVANIVLLESEGEYVRLHLNDGTKLVTLFRLKNMESALPTDMFMRVHRSYIINTNHISSYTKGRIFLDTDDYVPIGDSYKEAFAELVKRKL